MLDEQIVSSQIDTGVLVSIHPLFWRYIYLIDFRCVFILFPISTKTFIVSIETSLFERRTTISFISSQSQCACVGKGMI